MLSLISARARAWSGVSSNGKAASSSRCHSESSEKTIPFRRLALCVQLQQFASHRFDRLADPGLDPGPTRPAQLVQRRLGPSGAVVLLDQIETVDRHEQAVTTRELEDHEVPVQAAALGTPQSGVARDAVVHVDHECDPSFRSRKSDTNAARP